MARVDYLAARGMGSCRGASVGTREIGQDVLAVAAHLRAAPDIRAASIVAIGESLGGGGVLAALARKYFNNFHMILAGDHASYYVSHLSEFVLTAIAMPSGPVRQLPRAIDPDIGKTTFTLGGGGGRSLTLDDYLNNGKYRVQGLMVLHQGKVVYEAYPGMQPTQLHARASVSKTAVGLIAAILEADGALDVSKPSSAYVSELRWF